MNCRQLSWRQLWSEIKKSLSSHRNISLKSCCTTRKISRIMGWSIGRAKLRWWLSWRKFMMKHWNSPNKKCMGQLDLLLTIKGRLHAVFVFLIDRKNFSNVTAKLHAFFVLNPSKIGWLSFAKFAVMLDTLMNISTTSKNKEIQSVQYKIVCIIAL